MLVLKATMVNSGEVLVIYRTKQNAACAGEKEDVTSEKVERLIKYGPTRYIPQPNEWVHEFKWHGSCKAKPSQKVYGALQFTKLRIIADQTYHDVSVCVQRHLYYRGSTFPIISG